VSAPLRLGIAGVHGHGRTHVDAALALAGDVELAAVADPRGGGDVPERTRQFADATEMLDAGGLDLVVLCTPIPTHAELSLRALEAGMHVLLEKPPVVSVAQHEQVEAAAAAAGRAVQVGFQSLGSAGVAAARDLATSGELGELEHIGAVGLWSRSEEYWRRSAWSGRRFADGHIVADGAVTNPLAHAVATALAIAGARAPGDVAGVRTDLRRVNDIETDDTSSLVIELASGIKVAGGLAVTSPRRHEPYILLRGTRGYALFFYTLDLLQVHVGGSPLPRTYGFSRVGVLANLAAHVRDGDALAVPLAHTGAFTRVLEAVVSSPAPTRIAPDGIAVHQRDGEVFRVARGVEDAAERVAWEAKTFDEIGVLRGRG
jgi:predicted dehydrogenase